MPRIFVHFTFLLFILTALSGVWMRAFSFNPNTEIAYTNVMHAHSHLAILGWAFLGVFIIFLKILWPSIKQKKQAIALVFTIFITSFLMFAAFIYQGYDLYSIILSSVHVFVEYWGAIFIYRQLKVHNQIPKVGSLFMKGSVIALIISSIGPFSLGFISANGLRESDLFDMAIYFYLHFQYNGWLILFLIGLFIIILDKKRITIPTIPLKIGFWLYFLSLFPGYFSSILWSDDLGAFGGLLAAIGSIGLWVGVLFILFTCIHSWHALKKVTPRSTILCLGFIFLLLLMKNTMELGLISPAVAELIYNTRNVIIGYLHFTLLGVISIFILTQFQMTQIIDTNKEIVTLGFTTFFIGFVLNELLLFFDGLASWTHFYTVPFVSQGLLAASLFLLTGIVLLWLSTFTTNKSYKHLA